MASILLRSVLLVVFTIYALGDEIELEVHSNVVMKMLREMVNQTAADTLNLPANSTSIRENITDTFTCENRTYGFYADVDNECQVFHVCRPVQETSGHNLTYRYSFICPKETVFNQEVLVCTRPRDSIPCEESPDFYHLNMEIGKIVDTEANKEELDAKPNKETENIPTKKQNRYPNRKKQNIIMDALLKDAEEQMEEFQDVLNEEPVEIDTIVPEVNIETSEYKPEVPQYKPKVPQYKTEVPQYKAEVQQYKPEVPQYKPEVPQYKTEVPEYKDEFEDNTRLGLERSVKRTGRKMWRGSMKFKPDV